MFISKVDVFKAMISEPRQLILRTIDRGIRNLSGIAHELGTPRSTVEKHLRVLLRAGIVEKLPTLDERGRLNVKYEIKNVAYRLRAAL
jgi:DNA-binding transcriptional ArsR family regulator